MIEYVDLHGPLPENSLFYFESLNGVIKGFCHSTNRVAKTILRHVIANQALRRSSDKITDPEHSKFIDRLHNKRCVMQHSPELDLRDVQIQYKSTT